MLIHHLTEGLRASAAIVVSRTRKSSSMARTGARCRPIVFAALLLAMPWVAVAAVPAVQIVALSARGAIDRDGSLTVAVPLGNRGSGLAKRVTLTEVELQRAHAVTPATLPQALGDLQADDSVVVNLRFTLYGAAQRYYDVELEGRYTAPEEEDRDRRHRSEGASRKSERLERRDDERRPWHVHVRVDLAGTGNVAGTSGNAQGVTRQTRGPYPALPQSRQIEANEDNGASTPIGRPQTLFAPTITRHSARNPGITSFPGVTPDGAVGFVVNTGSGATLPFPLDPNAVAPGGRGQLAMVTGNTFIKVSSDGGVTFPTTITNFSTVFGDSPDGGYCCDQVLHYIPSIDRVVWLIQSNQTAAGASRERVAWARPADIAANFATAWTWFDLTPGFLGNGANDWLDYPDLAVSNGYLYVSFDDVTTGNGLVVARISLADLQKPGGQTVSWDFTHPQDGKTAKGSHLAQNATSTMYWGGHPRTNQTQVCHWADGSSQYACEAHDHNDYANGGSSYSSLAPDGQYWLAPQFSNDRIMSIVRRPSGELWFAWNAGRDATFAHPYVAVLKINEATLQPIDELEIWNPDHAYAYPALAVNPSSGEVSVSLLWGGGGRYFQNHAVGFLGDFVVWITTASDVTATASTPGSFCQDGSFAGNPANRCTRSGDYLGLRRVGTTTGLFATAGYEVKLGDTTKAVDCLAAGQSCSINIRYVVFGRPADTGGQPGIPPPR